MKLRSAISQPLTVIMQLQLLKLYWQYSSIQHLCSICAGHENKSHSGVRNQAHQFSHGGFNVPGSKLYNNPCLCCIDVWF
jgi:hypothetical protein